MNKKQFMAHCEPVADLVVKKHEDYQGHIFNLGDSFPLGDLSYAQMLWVKNIRVMSLAHQKFNGDAAPNHESLRDSVRDMLAYAVFYLEYLEATCETHGKGAS